MSVEAPIRYQGKIKFYKFKANYGFITSLVEDAPKKEVFVHKSALFKPGKSINRGENVSYEIAVDDKGRPYATNVDRPEAVPYVKKARKSPRKAISPEQSTKEATNQGDATTPETERKPKQKRFSRRRGPKPTEASKTEAVPESTNDATEKPKSKPKYRRNRRYGKKTEAPVPESSPEASAPAASA